jgi:hypothetical protein
MAIRGRTVKRTLSKTRKVGGAKKSKSARKAKRSPAKKVRRSAAKKVRRSAAKKVRRSKSAKKARKTKSKRARSPYNQFMADELPKYKKAHPSVEHKKAFAAVAKMWSARK